jgi:hypothetical protein
MDKAVMKAVSVKRLIQCSRIRRRNMAGRWG